MKTLLSLPKPFSWVLLLLGLFLFNSCGNSGPPFEMTLAVRSDPGTNISMEATQTLLRNRLDFMLGEQEKYSIKESDGHFIVKLDRRPSEAMVNTLPTLFLSRGQMDIYDTSPFTEAFPILQKINAKVQQQEGIEVDTSRTTELTAEEYLKENPFFSLFGTEQLDPDMPILGYVPQANVPTLMDYLNQSEIKALLPPGMDLIFGLTQQNPESGEATFPLIAIKTEKDGSAVLPVQYVKSCRATPTKEGTMVLNTIYNKEGEKILARLSRNNKNKGIAIALDGQVLMCPKVRSEITNGRTMLSGAYSELDLQLMATTVTFPMEGFFLEVISTQ